MPITFRHDAAAVALPSSSSTRKYGQQLVLQQQQQKYAAQQAGYDRMFDAYKQQTQNQFQFGRDQFQNEMAFRRENRQNAFQTERDKAMFDQRQQMMEAERQRAFMEEARKMSGGMIMDDIQNGNYDPATARQLQQNLVAESEALGNPQYDATQRAEALQKIRAARALLTSNRLQKPPPPTPDEEIASLPEMNGTKYQKNKNGVWEPLQPSKQQQQQQEKQQQDIEAMRPKSAQEYYGQNEDKFQKDLDSTMGSMQKDYELDPTKPAPTRESALKKMQEDYDFRQQALGKPQYGEPTLAPEDPGVAEYPAPGQAADQKLGTGAPQSVSQQQKVMIDGKPLVVTPGTLTPQETAARAEIMAMPREQRISALMPYDPETKGQTLEQYLENPKTKATYESMKKERLVPTGNYREDMLAFLDEQMKHNVLNGSGQSKPDAYVGMRADDITDPKAKAEIAKMPRPKSAEEVKTIRGSFFVDPNGVIRGTNK